MLMIERDQLTSAIESLLFSAGKASSITELARILEVDATLVLAGLQKLQTEYQESRAGIRIIILEKQAELVTAPENFSVVKKLIDYEKADITDAQLETLTIIAYQGPISRAGLENIRGVNCGQILRNLTIADLIDVQKLENDTCYSINVNFLKNLGIATVEDLPDYQTLNRLS